MMGLKNTLWSFLVGLIGIVSFSTVHAKDLARVNGRSITDTDLNLALPHLNEGQRKSFLGDENSKQTVLSQVIDWEVLAQEAEKQKIDQEKMLKDSVNAFRKKLIVDQLLVKKFSGELTPAAVQKYYKSHTDIFNTDLVKVQHILANSEEEAKRFLALVKEPNSDFQKLAEKYSRDPSAVNNRGDIGYITHFQMAPVFTEAAFATPVGQISGPIHTLYGYHIIKVTDKKFGKPLEFAEVEMQAREVLRQQLVSTYTSDLRAKARVQMADEL